MSEIELLSKLVAFDSVFPKEQKIAECLEQLLQERGFKTRRIPVAKNRFNVVGERGSQGKPIAFYGHMDTVPAYGDWQASPLKLREEAGRLYGLGACDMKAGLAAILKACEAATPRKIKVAFGVDEENNSQGAWALVQDGFLSDAECIIVSEINDAPSNSSVSIMLGRRGRAEYEFSVPGKSAHAAHIGDGISAINEASRLVLELEQNNNMRTHENLPAATQFVRKLHGETISLSLPESTMVVLDRHLVPPETSQSVLQDLQNTIDGLYQQGKFKEINGKRITVAVKPRDVPYLEPYTTPQNNPSVQRLTAAARTVMRDVSYTYGASVADENLLAMHHACVIGLCPKGGNEHTANEWVSKQSYLDLIKVLSQFIKGTDI